MVGFRLALSDLCLFSSSVGHCPDPLLVNGEFSSLEPVNVNDTITFKCNEHYVLKGSNWSRCLENHTWVPPFPVCKSSKYKRKKVQTPKILIGSESLAIHHIPTTLTSFLYLGRV